MAFTLSHIVAILPFKYSFHKLPFDALVIGAIIPDLPYFIADNNYIISHQWQGILIYCLPWGIVLLLLWRLLVKDLYSAVWNNKTSEKIELNLSNYKEISSQIFFVVLAIVIGTSTHIVWDGITHPNGFIATKFDFLEYPVISYKNSETTVLSRFLQYVTSILGLIILFFLAKKNIKLKDENFNVRNKLIMFILAIGIFFTVGAICLKYEDIFASDTYLFFSKILIELGQASILLIIIFSLSYQAYRFLKLK